MKVARGELKKMIGEEIEQALEEGWWEDAKRGVDKKLGTKMSHRTRSADKEKARLAAIKAGDQTDQDERDEHDPDSLHYDPAAVQSRQDRLKQMDADRREKEAAAAPPKRTGTTRDQLRRSRGKHDKYDPDPYNKTHRVSNRAGSGNMGYGESIDRGELKKIIKEKLAKVLQGK
jgi:hypothetical protein